MVEKFKIHGQRLEYENGDRMYSTSRLFSSSYHFLTDKGKQNANQVVFVF